MYNYREPPQYLMLYPSEELRVSRVGSGNKEVGGNFPMLFSSVLILVRFIQLFRPPIVDLFFLCTIAFSVRGMRLILGAIGVL